jgi:hypothetical protein
LGSTHQLFIGPFQFSSLLRDKHGYLVAQKGINISIFVSVDHNFAVVRIDLT